MLDTEKVPAAAIAARNDELRKCLPNPLPFPHQAVMTDEIASLPDVKIQTVLGMVRDFDTFTPDCDPYGERDFGSFDFEGQKIFWKFDYYDVTRKYFEENGNRVLTIMFASEY